MATLDEAIVPKGSG